MTKHSLHKVLKLGYNKRTDYKHNYLSLGGAVPKGREQATFNLGALFK